MVNIGGYESQNYKVNQEKYNLSRDVLYTDNDFQHCVINNKACQQSDNYGNKQLYDSIT